MDASLDRYLNFHGLLRLVFLIVLPLVNRIIPVWKSDRVSIVLCCSSCRLIPRGRELIPPPISRGMQWIYDDSFFTEDQIENAIGFVYLIENTVNGRKYLGKKGFYKSKTFQKNLKKKKKKVFSDWQKYYGSSEELKQDIKEYGKDKFKRTILRLCYSKSEMNYFELREQIIRDVLLKPNEYFNSYVGTRINRNQLKRLIENGKTENTS